MNETTHGMIRSEAAEYLTYAATVGEQLENFEIRYEDSEPEPQATIKKY